MILKVGVDGIVVGIRIDHREDNALLPTPTNKNMPVATRTAEGGTWATRERKIGPAVWERRDNA